ncbi:MAG: N-acetylmuramoyl-L-alanine amidase [Pseudomonadota bacterium]
MHRRSIWILALSGLATSCLDLSGLQPFTDEGDPAEQAFSGEVLLATFTPQGPYLVSPVLEVPDGATRIALMVDLADERDLFEIHGAAADPSQAALVWETAVETWREGSRHVARIELAGVSHRAQIRLPAIEAPRIVALVWSALVPPERASVEEGQAPRTRPSIQRQALVTGAIPRSGWGARAPSCVTPESFFNRMTVHHTVTAPSINGDFAARIREIQAYHMDGRGYCDIAYNYLVTTDGRTWEGRGTNRGGHVLNENANNIGVSFIGCFHTSDCAGLGPNIPPAEMILGGAVLIGALAIQHGIAISGSTVLGHRDIGQTACPGDHLYGRLGEIRDRARQGGTAVDDGGCTPTQRSNCGAYGCGCADGQCSGGYCPGNGCSAQQVQNCGAYGCNCVDGQCNGGYCPGTGCTVKETQDCGNYGCGCVDHACNGVFCEGTGCTARETLDCGNYGCTCVDHACNGAFCEGSGCTAREALTCTDQAQDCKDHTCRSPEPSCDPDACAVYGVICCPGMDGCVNWFVDNGNCGGCGVTCTTGETCDLGRCEGADGCTSDERNGCGNTACVDGVCQPTPVVDAGSAPGSDAGAPPALDAGAANMQDSAIAVDATPGTQDDASAPSSADTPDNQGVPPDQSGPSDNRASAGCGCHSASSGHSLVPWALALLLPWRRRRACSR